MDPEIARSVAVQAHADQLTRFGEPVIEHVERVAERVPPHVRALAYLHDVLERSELTVRELRDHGLTETECSALELLSRIPTDAYETYVLRIATAPGKSGRIARMIKLADLADHLRHPITEGAPDYAWARERIVASNKSRFKQRRADANVGKKAKAAA